MNRGHALLNLSTNQLRCFQEDTLTNISVKTNYASTNYVKLHVKLTAFDIEILHESLALDKAATSCFITHTVLWLLACQSRNCEPGHKTVFG